ncbi:MAG: hypothetical protein P8R42_16455 [Candidatus Binatia bacterium]|nr:hypothetical protein [Candidatus Binatia bacterium]
MAETATRVAQFAKVSGPVVSLELGQGLRRDAAHLAVEPGCFLGDEVLDECGDVLMSVAQPR